MAREGFRQKIKGGLQKVFRKPPSLLEEESNDGARAAPTGAVPISPDTPAKIATSLESSSGSSHDDETNSNVPTTASAPLNASEVSGGDSGEDDDVGAAEMDLVAAELHTVDPNQPVGVSYMELASLSGVPDGALTASFGSNHAGGEKSSFISVNTDFDNVTCPGAQAELDDHYLRNVYGATAAELKEADVDPMMPKYAQSSSFKTNSFASNRGGAPPPTGSFGSTATDFDNLTSLGAQAERDDEYLARAAGGAPAFFKMAGTGADAGAMEDQFAAAAAMTYAYSAAAGGVCLPPWNGGFYPPWGGGYYPQFPQDAEGQAEPYDMAHLTAQAASLDIAAAQFREAARQAEEAASMARNHVSQTLGATKPPKAGGVWQTNESRAQNKTGGGKQISTKAPTGPNTTVMLRNLPNDYTREMLLDLLNEHGFQGKYDFVYMPMDFKRWAGLGYAFANMVTHEDAVQMIATLNGFSKWKRLSAKVCEVAWGDQGQGLEAHIDRYRNSPVMHPDMPDEAKPVLFKDGTRVPFPEPTKKLRPPRVKR